MITRRSFDQDDEVRSFLEGSGELGIINTINGPVGRVVFNPGFQWSKHVAPIVGTDLCMAAYVVIGQMTISQGDDVTTYSPGNLALITPGHDAWTEGNEPCIVIDWQGFGDYAKSAAGDGQ